MVPFAIYFPLTMKIQFKPVAGLLELALVFALVIVAPSLHAQGPPYQTDDPVPVDYGHYEFYIFGSADGTPVEMDSAGPAF